MNLEQAKRLTAEDEVRETVAPFRTGTIVEFRFVGVTIEWMDGQRERWCYAEMGHIECITPYNPRPLSGR